MISNALSLKYMIYLRNTSIVNHFLHAQERGMRWDRDEVKIYQHHIHESVWQPVSLWATNMFSKMRFLCSGYFAGLSHLS